MVKVSTRICIVDIHITKTLIKKSIEIKAFTYTAIFRSVRFNDSDLRYLTALRFLSLRVPLPPLLLRRSQLPLMSQHNDQSFSHPPPARS